MKFAEFIADVVILACLLVLGLFVYSTLFAPELINAFGCAVQTDNDISYQFCTTIANINN